MRILKIWDADYPWDVRVEKIVTTLSQNGHSVSMVCRNLKNLPTFESMGPVKIFRLPPIRSKSLNRFISFPYFFNLLWWKTIYTTCRKERAQVILVRDLPLALTAIALGRRLRIPVILDMAENYPAMLRARRYYGRISFHQKWVLRNAALAALVERLTLKWVDKIIVVAEENKRRLLGKGVSPENIYLVSNTPDLDSPQSLGQNFAEEERAYFAERFTLIYTGLLGSVRGMETVVKAMPEIIRKIPEAHLLVIGRGMSEQTLTRLVEERGLGKYVTFKGWVDSGDLPKYLRASRAGLIPHLATEHTNTTLPNKIFDYMAHGLPVVASDVGPLKRIIEEEKCGVTFAADNADDFVRAVVRVYKDPENRFGENGKRAVFHRYNWKEDSAALLKIFEELERKDAGKARPRKQAPNWEGIGESFRP